jgi:hypothetical protein
LDTLEKITHNMTLKNSRSTVVTDSRTLILQVPPYHPAPPSIRLLIRLLRWWRARQRATCSLRVVKVMMVPVPVMLPGARVRGYRVRSGISVSAVVSCSVSCSGWICCGSRDDSVEKASRNAGRWKSIYGVRCHSRSRDVRIRGVRSGGESSCGNGGSGDGCDRDGHNRHGQNGDGCHGVR